jgi:uncharacterized Zn finger protein (UPF0148 family)
MTTTLICPICGTRWKVVPTTSGHDFDLLSECPVCADDDGGVREPAPSPPHRPRDYAPVPS